MSRTGISLAGFMLCAVSTIAAAQEATTTYRLTHVWTRSLDPAHENDEFVVNGIDDRGQLAGYRIPGGAFVWRNGTFENLQPFSSPMSWAVAVSDWSHVAGFYVNPALGTSSFLHRGGTNVVPIAELPGETSVDAIHLNNRGEILLGAIANGGLRHYVWRRGERVLLPTVPDRSTTPLRINDAGTVVGNASGGGVTVPVLWQNGTVMPIELPEGATHGLASDVNDAGVVTIDTFDSATGSSASHRWRDGEYAQLAMPSGYSRSQTFGINNAGVVVGTASGAPANTKTAAVWHGAQAHDLNTLVQPNDPLKPFVRLSFALHVNDRGEIVARGVDERQGPDTVSHYLLMPRH